MVMPSNETKPIHQDTELKPHRVLGGWYVCLLIELLIQPHLRTLHRLPHLVLVLTINGQ